MRYYLSRNVSITLFIVFVVLTSTHLSTPTTTLAALTGPCSDCHTMHYSQDGAIDGPTGGPFDYLLKGDCIACHAQGGATALDNSSTTDPIPQVFHSEANKDLAGGNFGYITGLVGLTAASDNKGHNITDIPGIGPDSLILPPGAPPGQTRLDTHWDGLVVNTSNLTCAGANGCHGVRLYDFDPTVPPLPGLQGAHHENQSGALHPNGEWRPGYGYRFLQNVTGYEDPQWEYNKTVAAHNEYYGQGTPENLNLCNDCHVPFLGLSAINGTMSQFCATCHGNFHTLENAGGGGGLNEGIGDGASPFVRHPTDLTIPNRDEYSDATTYSLQVPVARSAPPAGPVNTLTPGTDIVMCLSCHVAHASDYPDMLRWDYTTMVVGSVTDDGTGCFVCHTAKDGV